MPARSRRERSQHPSKRNKPTLRSEQLEQRMLCTVNGLLNNLEQLLGNNPPALHAGSSTLQGPALARTITSGASVVKGTSTTLSALGSDGQGEASLSYTWTVIGAPTGGMASFSANGTNSAKNTTVNFTKAGVYTIGLTMVDDRGMSFTTSVRVTVAQTLTSISLVKPDGTPLAAGGSVSTAGTSQQLGAQGFDQFGNAMNYPFSWSASTNGSKAGVSFLAGGMVLFNFYKAGTYAVTVRGGDGGAAVTVNATIVVKPVPTYLEISQVGGSREIRGNSAQFMVNQVLDQFRNSMAAATSLSWSMTSGPFGVSAPRFVTAGGVTTATFAAAGRYILTATLTDGQGNSISKSINVSVAAVPTSLASTSGDVTTGGVSAQLTAPTILDQFGNALPAGAAVSWSVTSGPSGAPAVRFATSGGVFTATFGKAGRYVIKGMIGGLSFTENVNVTQTLTDVVVTPGSVNLQAGGVQQFTAQARDQFKQATANQPAFTWTATGGTIDSTGKYTAPSSANTYTVTVASGGFSARATVAVTAPTPTPTPTPNPAPAPSGIQNAALASLVQSLDGDGSLSRNDMIQILRSAANDGSVDATELSDLRWLVSHAGTFNMAGYVQVLTNDVVNGNAANSTFQGQTLGNLAAGSSATQMNHLVDKWFLGADHPTIAGSYTYQVATGSLFNGTPSHLQEFQGMLGDCYFISSLGTIADRNPQAIQNMFIDNGDGTFTVRLYAGSLGMSYNAANGSWSDGFTSGQGTADYITVDRYLPTNGSGTLVFANYGMSINSSSNGLWIALAEKAYAEWNATGKEGRYGKNAYTSIEGGWMATVDAQVLGHNAADYAVNNAANKQNLINALNSGKAVTIGTNGGNSLPYGLYGSHAYAVIGYNASADTFTLYNPWGFAQPSALTWSQIQATCSEFVVADASGSAPISASVLSAAVTAGQANLWTSVADVAANVFAPTVGNALNSGTQSVDHGSPAGQNSASAAEVHVLRALAEQMATHQMNNRALQADAGAAVTVADVDAVLSQADFGPMLSEAIA